MKTTNSTALTEGVTPAPRPPLLRNPWFWGVLAGLIFVPVIRPFMRHIPDAPPVLAELPDYELLQGSGGQKFLSLSLSGRVYVLGLYGQACAPGCDNLLAALEALSERFVRFERGITVVAAQLPLSDVPGSAHSEVDIHSSAKSASIVDRAAEWQLVEVGRGQLDLVASRHLAPQIEGLGMTDSGVLEVAQQGRIFLVDAFGSLRGHYGIDEVGLDEAYHRAQHVLRDHRIAGEILGKP